MMRHLAHDRLITVFFFAINLHQNELFANYLDGSMADASSAAAAATGAWQRSTLPTPQANATNTR